MDASAAVLVWNDNPDGNKVAAPFLAGLFSECADVYVVAPPDADVPADWWEAVGATLRIEDDNPARAVDKAIQECEAALVHVVRSDVMLSPVWSQAALTGCSQWPAVGCAGPQLTGSQHVKIPEEVLRRGFGAICEHAAGRFAGKFVRGDWLDAVAIAFNRAKYLEIGPLDAGIPDLSWALRDWGHRARLAGSGVMVSPSAYAQILDRSQVSPWARGGAASRLAYYRKHADPSRQERLAASWIIHPSSTLQIELLLESARSAAPVARWLHVALVEHPRGFLEGDGPKLPRHRGKLTEIARIEDAAEACAAFGKWLRSALKVPKEQIAVSWVPPGWPSLPHLELAVTRDIAAIGATWCLRLQEGEVIEPSVTRPDLQRLMRHPDPMVLAYNVGISFCWESRDLLREDPPFGDGGSLRGDQRGTNDLRLYRTNGPRLVTDGARVANLRLLNTGLQDPRWRRPGVSQEGMRCTRANNDTRIGLHFLAYGGAEAADVARWLDWTHGLTAAAVMVWNGDTPIEDTEHAEIAEVFGVDVVQAEVAGINFAAWRNEAIDRLELARALQSGTRSNQGKAPAEGDNGDPRIAWGWFVDPDEWVDHPVHDLLPLRRCVESHDRAAYLFHFRNYRAGGQVTTSSTIRLHRLHEGMRMHGRVHESFGQTLATIQDARGGRAIGRAPVEVHNRGTVDPQTGAAKLELYEQLIRDELADDPHSTGHWVGLSWQYAANGHAAEARVCLDRAVECSGNTAYLPWFERAMLSVRQGRADLREALRRLPPDHHHHAEARAVLDSLVSVADAQPVPPEIAPKPLPAYSPPEPEDAETGGRST